MKFYVSRTTMSWDEQKPCDEARSEGVIRVDIRTVNDPAKVTAHKGDSAWWYSEGKNHRVENGYIKRDFDDVVWVVEINTLDELLKFLEKYGSCVTANKHYSHPSLASIEIYDDYRE